MKIKGFTLIELLVVVAIIGILAAVGVISFGGFTEAAKSNAVKSQHKNLVNLINSNKMKCEITGVNSIQLNGGWHICKGPLYLSQSGYVSHIHNEGWKNPFRPNETVVASCPGKTGLAVHCCINNKNYLNIHSCLDQNGTDSIITNLTD
jgi:type IV pilus assembly protein PilA